MSFLHCISSFEGNSFKICKIQSLDLLFIVVFNLLLSFYLLLAFTIADIIFHKFLKLHSALSERKIFVTNFPFLTESLKPPPPP